MAIVSVDVGNGFVKYLIQERSATTRTRIISPAIMRSRWTTRITSWGIRRSSTKVSGSGEMDGPTLSLTVIFTV